MQEIHDILNHVFMIDDGLLQTQDFLEEHRVMGAELAVPLMKLLELALSSDELRVDEVHLLCWHRFFRELVRLLWDRRFSSYVVEGVFVVRFKIGVFEFPCLAR